MLLDKEAPKRSGSTADDGHGVEHERPPPSLTTLPPEVVSKIAYDVFSIDPVGPPVDVRSLCLTCRALNRVLGWRSNAALYSSLFALQFDMRAPRRRFGAGCDRFRAENVVQELRKRWNCLSRVRAIERGRESEGDEDRRHRESYFTIAQELETDLWTIYVLLLEDDGNNLRQLLEYAGLDRYIELVWRERLLKCVDEPALPVETADRALALWIIWFTCSDRILQAEQPLIAQSNLFALRPYALAAHQYEAFYAPWHEDVMPSNPKAGPAEPRTTIEYFGSALPIAPPKAALAAIMLFSLRRSARPDAVDAGTLAAHPNTPGQQNVDIEGRPPFAAEVSGGRGSLTWDTVWKRQVLCWDSRAGKGLDLSDTDVNGVWEGTFAFFEFDAYREMLFGSSRAVYDSTFASQAQIWRMRAAPAHLTDTDKGMILDRRRGRAEPDDEAEMDEWVWGDEQVVIGGTGHSSWGLFTLKGSIRTWDGLIQFQKDYVPAGSRGSWLYRGYLVGDNHLVGRWRDTFTEKTQNGYEGIFAMARRS